MSKVFCIGNGESRKDFDLQSLRPHGKIYGCNALYRDFTPDVLTAVDHGIMHEIYNSGYCYKNETWLRDWTRLPAEAYDGLVYGHIDEATKIELNKWDIKKENKRTTETEFVMHGSNLSGVATILKQNKEKFLKQINQSNICISWTRDDDKAHSLTEIMPNGRDWGWACGATSGYVALTKEKPTELYMIGHDLNSTTGKINNVYKGSLHYGLPEAGPIPSSNWITQWKSLFEQNPKVTFYKVNQHNKGIDRVNTRVHEWNNIKNIKYINYDDLKSALTK
jgi:hypothetical protein